MPHFKPLPPLAQLRRLLALRSDGVLIWKRPNTNKVRPGMVAGRWSNGYRVVHVAGASYFNHRLVWALVNNCDPGQQAIDHINGNPADNRPCNLRLCDQGKNMLNTRLRTDNTSGVKGISYDPTSRSRPWRSYFRGKKLGRFATREEAFETLEKYVADIEDKAFYRFDFVR